jgi:hypothetical protein
MEINKMDTAVIWGMVLFTSFISLMIWSHLLLNTPVLHAQWLEETPHTQLEYPAPFASQSTPFANPYETSGSMG